MQVQNDCVVEIHYELRNDAGDLLDTSGEEQPLTFLYGRGNLISGLENALDGKNTGDTFEVSLAPEQAYGERQEEAIKELPLNVFEGIDGLKVGMRLQAQTDQGPIPIVVTQIGDESVTVDGNHELAGETLHFKVSVENVREATPQELEQGQAL